MAVKWTKQQRQVIDLRNTDILVSAAAGSGKTAVLVQRIIEKIMDEDNPVNIDQLVIVTFTQAAAGEMRERILAAIEQQAALHPENAHLQRQKTRIHMAIISTIHSFCKHIIQNHFQEIDLEPSFRIVDSGEAALLRQDVLDEVLEQYYEEGKDEFLRFTEHFASGRDDSGVAEVILQLYDAAMSNPNPERWLFDCQRAYQVENSKQLMETEWMQALFVHLKGMAAYAKEKILQAENLIAANPSCAAYESCFSYYKQFIKQLNEQEEYQAWFRLCSSFSRQKLPTGKRSCPDVALREELKGLRDELNSLFEDLKKKYFVQEEEVVLRQLKEMRPVIEMLVEVTLAFWRQFWQEKRKKNMLDFNDLEHEALRILVDENGDPTKTALEYAQYYDEILIDEYQDSNLVQEALLVSISKHAFGKHNLFMVGDSKQSIYRFRQARPELFMEKFHAYASGAGQQQRIDLHKNFRSRREVLSFVNYMFARIMHETVGGIAYDEEAALYQGREFEEPKGRDGYETELLIFDKKENETDLSAAQVEARILVNRIRQMVKEEGGLLVQDSKTGTMRPAQYGDIAILLRSTTGFDTVLVKEMAAVGIPAHVLSKDGYFNTLEVKTILNYLSVIDNPLQDIPLLSVLKSPIGRITDEELAKIRIYSEKACLYDCIREYNGQCGEEDELQQKLSEFLEQLQQFRLKMNEMPIHKFLCHILDKTGYGDYVRLMPGGEQRRANMDMLVEKAAAYEKTSYLGVFQFIRYIEQLQKYKIEMGEASIAGENDNTVRIMTIHKSKGLEFPIVFAAGLGKDFNRTERSKKIVIHPSFGVGIDYVNLKLRQKQRLLLKEVFLQQNYLEELGEELRVLYVALTRAKEKLVLCGGVSNLEDRLKWAYAQENQNALSYGGICSAKRFMDWILCALIGHRDMQPLLESYVEKGHSWEEASAARCLFPVSFAVREIKIESLFEDELMEMAAEERTFLLFDREKEDCKGTLSKEVEQKLLFCYPFERENAIPVKVSVSELKGEGLSQFVQQEEEAALLFQKADTKREKKMPSFIQKPDEGISALERGNAYHKAFECLDFTNAASLQQVEGQLEQLYACKKLEPKLKGVLRPQKLMAFARSPVGERIARAQAQGRLYREQPFVYSVRAEEIDPEWDSSQPVMIQGILDVFFEEEDGLVLLDYKTDYVKPGQESILKERYVGQMNYYRRALSNIMGKPVKECILYSICLERFISI